ncbi:MAG: SdrD B-like domain-containing protein [Verrucomicrobiales bacterium]
MLSQIIPAFSRRPERSDTKRLFQRGSGLVMVGAVVVLTAGLGRAQDTPPPRCADVTGVVWEDLNRNGLREAGEPGLEGFHVRIHPHPSDRSTLCTSLSPYPITFTDAQGCYTLSAIGAQEAWIEVSAFQWPGPTFFAPTLRDVGDDDSIDSDFFDEGVDYATTPRFLISPEVSKVSGVDIGLVRQPATYGGPPGTVRGRAFLAESDGTQPAEGGGIGGVRVDLLSLDRNRAPLQSTVTDADGNYAIQAPPGHYRLRFNSPPHRAVTLNRFAGDDPDRDSNVDSAGVVAPFIIRSEETLDHIDAGFVALTDLVFHVWQDMNGDGIRATDEPPISGIRVELWDRDRTEMVRYLITGPDGSVRFYLTDHFHEYRISVKLRSSRDNFSPGFLGGFLFPTLDSDLMNAGPDAGFTLPIRVDPATNVLHAGQAGIVSLPSGTRVVSGRVFRADITGPDGNVQNGLAGFLVDLFLLYDNNNPRSYYSIGAYGITNQSGEFSITLRFESQVRVVLGVRRPDGGMPDGLIPTLDSDIGENGFSRPTTLPAEGVWTNVRASYAAPARIRGRVWHDQNADGLQDPSEPGLSDLPLIVTSPEAPTRRWERATQPDGAFEFTLPATSRIRLEALRAFLGDTFSPKNLGPPAADSDITNAGPDFGLSDLLVIPSAPSELSALGVGVVLAPLPRAVVPTRLNPPVRSPDGSWSLQFSGPIGGMYRLQQWDAAGADWIDSGNPFTTTEASTRMDPALPAESRSAVFRIRRLK